MFDVKLIINLEPGFSTWASCYTCRLHQPQEVDAQPIYVTGVGHILGLNSA